MNRKMIRNLASKGPTAQKQFAGIWDFGFNLNLKLYL